MSGRGYALARRAAWLKERAEWRLANRGDNWYSAEKRLFRFQMTEFRKKLQHDQLLARRKAYVEARDAKATQEHEAAQRRDAAESGAKEQSVPAQTWRDELAADRARLHRREAASKKSKREKAVKTEAERSERESAYRREWLAEVIEQNDVDGSRMGQLPIAAKPAAGRRQSWWTPDNFERRLNSLLMRSRSPIDRWNETARTLIAEDEKANLAHTLGGKIVGGREPDSAAADASDDALAEETLAKARNEPGAPSRVVVQVRRDAMDGSGGYTLVDYASTGRKRGKLTLRERVALLPDEAAPTADLDPSATEAESLFALPEDSDLPRGDSRLPRGGPPREVTDPKDAAVLAELQATMDKLDRLGGHPRAGQGRAPEGGEEPDAWKR